MRGTQQQICLQQNKDGDKFMAFKRERDLFEAAFASKYIQNLINSEMHLNYFVEPKGLFGIPDLLIVNADPSQIGCKEHLQTFAFEMKLTKWKRAMIQAFRYKAFANYSFVLVDMDHVAPALSNIEQFKKSNIGLMSVNQYGDSHVHFQPYFDSPFSNNLGSFVSEMIFKP
jgi:hypothetical protein